MVVWRTDTGLAGYVIRVKVPAGKTSGIFDIFSFETINYVQTTEVTITIPYHTSGTVRNQCDFSVNFTGFSFEPFYVGIERWCHKFNRFSCRIIISKGVQIDELKKCVSCQTTSTQNIGTFFFLRVKHQIWARTQFCATCPGMNWKHVILLIHPLNSALITFRRVRSKHHFSSWSSSAAHSLPLLKPPILRAR